MAVAAVAHTFVFSYTDFEHHFDGMCANNTKQQAS